MRTDLLKQKEQILKCIDNKFTLTEMSNIFNCKIETLKRYFKKLEIEYRGDQGKGFRNGTTKNKRTPALEYAKQTNCKPIHLKYKLIEEGIKEKRCENCGLSEWMNAPIPLQLHHEDGNRANNDLSNLKLLCMNCHGQTDNFGSKNNKRKINEHLIVPLIEKKELNKIKRIEFENRPKRTYRNLTDEEKKLKYKRKYGNDRDYHDAIKKQWENEQQKYVQSVLNSGINFYKFGWVNKIAIIIKQKPQRVHIWMKRIMPEFYREKCFKRNKPPVSQC